MKKRSMKKWIPKGLYCKGCKWRNIVGYVQPKVGMTYSIYRCEYMNYTDFEEDSLLWDGVKECGVKDI